MKSYLLENTSCELEKIIEELNRGREFTCRLREMIKKPHVEDEDAHIMLAEDLLRKIMTSFCVTLSILRSSECTEVSQVLKSPEEYSSGSCKTLSLKDRRGRYKRRRTLETSIKETSTLVDDGHAWRKFGQKQILNAKYPRNYFRCTHKFDQGCKANKQVQKIQENPPLFRITYYGHHTCNTFPKVSQMICDSPSNEDSNSVLLNFNSSNNNHHHFFGYDGGNC
ncbi:hypothetical protein K7X08_007217 [Anisodus acutangulus]|uniref:WRKY domain-containing protein n=1 Tax=Anisodus acutangulus TaxID=402998 RepID=A0A9Q1LFE0_9SOLA|nr:hypothetical protein K7X08_007217 [Anisodus acutangulus]